MIFNNPYRQLTSAPDPNKVRKCNGYKFVNLSVIFTLFKLLFCWLISLWASGALNLLPLNFILIPVYIGY